MDPADRASRYSKLAWREVQTHNPRQPQFDQAQESAGGDPEAATQYYVSARVAENTDIEIEREAAEKRLRKLRQLHDGPAMTGQLKVFLFGVPLVLVIFCMFYRLFCK